MIGLGTAKSVIQFQAIDETRKVQIRRKLRRSELIPPSSCRPHAVQATRPGCMFISIEMSPLYLYANGLGRCAAGRGSAMSFERLPGQYAIETLLKETFLTAVGGGGRTSDAIHTDTTQPSAEGTFSLWVDRAERIVTPQNAKGFLPYAVQTASGNYLTAVDGGGRTSDVLHTDATEALAWEKFGLIPQTPAAGIYPANYDWRRDSPWYYALATSGGNYLTAVSGGGQTVDPTIHSDAIQANSWEMFRLICSGELMPGYQYAFRPVFPVDGYTMAAAAPPLGAGSGDLFMEALSAPFLDRKPWARFRLLQLDDGSYALQTWSRNYVTAVGGGDKASLAFHADAVTIGSWESFRILDQGDFTYVMQTSFGWYVGLLPNGGPNGQPTLRTDIATIADAARFRLSPLLHEID
jgi:hypothetical protein